MHDQTDDSDSDSQATLTEKPSKSQRKREALAVQKLGAALVALKPAQLEKFTALLSDPLYEAISSAQAMHQRGARKRQLQFIGKLMRDIDTTAIAEALAVISTHGTAQKRQQRDIEQLCSALLNGQSAPLTEFLQHYPDADRQHIRQLIRNAKREQEHAKAPKSARLLHRYLRALVQQKKPLK